MDVRGHDHVSDLRGAGRVALEATRGLIDLVGTLQRTIDRGPGILGLPAGGPPRGFAAAVLRGVRGVTELVGAGIDVALGELARVVDEARTPQEVEAVLAALNGVLGDYLAATASPLAIQMRLRRGGRPLVLEQRSLRWALPRASQRMLLLVHGSSMNPLQWNRRGHDHGVALEHDLGLVAVHLQYNSGLRIPANGRALAALLEMLVAQWAVRLQEFVIVAHGMGGLVVRSACHAAASAGHRWPGWLRRIVFLGTPHCGGVVERGGKWLDLALGISPHSAAFARLRKVRSAGWTDLKRGVVLEEDGSEEEVRSVPLPAGVECYAMAAVRARERGVRAASDGLVPLNSALGRHTDPRLALSFPNGHTWVGQGMNHLDLLSFPEAYEVLSGWLSREPRAGLVPARVQK